MDENTSSDGRGSQLGSRASLARVNTNTVL